MKKFCVLFVGIVILAIAGISAYGTEEKPVESELGSYYEEAVDQENSETDVVMLSTKKNGDEICRRISKEGARSLGRKARGDREQ